MMKKKEIIYHYVLDYLELIGISPTVHEISEACDLSQSTVIYHLDHLCDEGHLVRDSYRARSIRMPDQRSQEEQVTESIYEYIVQSIEDGRIPTQEEIAVACFTSRSTVRRSLHQLVDQKRICLVDGRRNIRLLEQKGQKG